MKTARYYIILFLVVFFITAAVAPSTGPGAASPEDRIMQTPWQDYDGLIRV